MRYRYLDNFRRGISVFAIFSDGVTVLGTPQCPPLFTKEQKYCSLMNSTLSLRFLDSRSFVISRTGMEENLMF